MKRDAITFNKSNHFPTNKDSDLDTKGHHLRDFTKRGAIHVGLQSLERIARRPGR